MEGDPLAIIGSMLPFLRELKKLSCGHIKDSDRAALWAEISTAPTPVDWRPAKDLYANGPQEAGELISTMTSDDQLETSVLSYSLLSGAPPP